MSRLYHAPGDWLTHRYTSRDRRSFGFWTITLSTIGAIFFGNKVLYVTILSILALIPNFAAETPVEPERGDG